MKELDPQHLFYDSPYPVKLDDGEYIFRTDHDIVYAVSFIVPRSHPYLDDIIKHFDSEISMFRANKP